MLGYVLAVRPLRRLRGGLWVAQQLAGGFAGVRLPLPYPCPWLRLRRGMLAPGSRAQPAARLYTRRLRRTSPNPIPPKCVCAHCRASPKSVEMLMPANYHSTLKKALAYWPTLFEF